MRHHVDVVVVGAGPYGLSIGAHLAARGVRFRVFGQPMHSWRSHMPQGMLLKSPGRASSLSDPARAYTLENFCRATGSTYSDGYADGQEPISAELFVRYGEWFQQSLVPDLDPRQILSCELGVDGFLLQVEDGETLTAKSVVVSSGYMASARMPHELVGLPPDLVSHSSAHSSFARFDGKDVIVLGAGQSALESAALLAEAGARPRLVARCRSLTWGRQEKLERTLYERLRYPMGALGPGWRYVFYEHFTTAFRSLPAAKRKKLVDTTLGPAGACWLHDRVVTRMPILLGWTLREAHAEADQVVLRLQQGREIMELPADHVIAATGYRLGPASFPFLAPALRRAILWEHGAPKLSRHFESSVPGLHFTGLASAYSFGPVMRFVAGAQVTAPRLCGYLAARHRRATLRTVTAPGLRKAA